MSIPYGEKYHATVSGQAMKTVRCEKCGGEYGYVMFRVASGEGTSLLFLDTKGAQERANQRAQESLNQVLENERDAVPCPTCGWYQDHMIPIIRAAHRYWMFVTGAISLCAAVVSLAFAYSMHEDLRRHPLWISQVLEILSAVFGISGVALLTVRSVQARRLRPNETDEASRIALGRQRAVMLGDAGNSAESEPLPTSESDAFRTGPPVREQVESKSDRAEPESEG